MSRHLWIGVGSFWILFMLSLRGCIDYGLCYFLLKPCPSSSIDGEKGDALLLGFVESTDRNSVPAFLLEHMTDALALSLDAVGLDTVLLDKSGLH